MRRIAVVLLVVLTVSTASAEPAKELAGRLRAASDADRYTIWAAANPTIDAELRSALMAEMRASRGKPEEELFASFIAEVAKNDRHLFAMALARISSSYMIKQPAAAAALLPQALAAAHLGDNDYAVSTVAYNIAQFHRQRGEVEAAVPILEMSVACARAAGESEQLANALNSLAISQRTRGRFQESLTAFHEALELFEKIGSAEAIAGTTNNIGITYREMGDHEHAIITLQRALHAAEKINHEQLISFALTNIGSVLSESGDLVGATAAFERSLAIKERRGDRVGTVTTLSNLGDVERSRQHSDKAFAYYSRAMAAATSSGNLLRLTEVLSNVAKLALEDKRPHVALAFSTHGLVLAEQIGYTAAITELATICGSALTDLDRFDEARQMVEMAIAETEFERLQIAADRHRQSYFSANLSPYMAMIKLHARMGDAAGALRYAEQAKARGLVDVLRHGEIGSRSISAADREREDALHRDVVEAAARLDRARRDRKPTAAIERDFTAKKRAYDDHEQALYTTYTRLRAERGAAEFLGEETLGAALERGTAVIEYVLTEHAFAVIVATRGAGGAIETRLHVDRPDYPAMKRRIKQFRTRIANRDLGVADDASRLFQQLVAPLWPALRGSKRIIVIPDDVLWEVPFQALRAPDGKYLIEHAAIAYAPSITALAEMKKLRTSRKQEPTYDLVAFGTATGGQLSGSGATLPAVAEAEQQVLALRDVYGAKRARVFTGEAASESAFKREAGDARLVHITAHGVFDDRNPLHSHLVMPRGGRGDDGALDAWELARLDLRSDLVVLAACDTARGVARGGEGLIGMTWALFVGGCPSTLVTQWSVDAASTTEFMLTFHKALRGSPRPTKSAALRHAALAMLRGGKQKHPFYWAPFVLIGDDAPM